MSSVSAIGMGYPALEVGKKFGEKIGETCISRYDETCDIIGDEDSKDANDIVKFLAGSAISPVMLGAMEFGELLKDETISRYDEACDIIGDEDSKDANDTVKFLAGSVISPFMLKAMEWVKGLFSGKSE
jgi:hypothetical protein